MMLVVSVNKIQIASMLQRLYRVMVHNEDNKAVKLSLERLTGVVKYFFYKPAGSIAPHISTANIITPEGANKYGYGKSSLIMDSHGYAMVGNGAGLNYGG